MEIRIACQGAELLEIGQMTELQGELKSLSEENYQKLKNEIVETGYAFPIHIWQDGDVNYIVGGTQRKRTLQHMAEEGFEIPPLPVVIVEAASVEEAKRRVLQDVSQYGKLERQGLYEFLTGSGMDTDSLSKSFDLPAMSLDIENFKEEFYEDHSVPPGEDDGGGAPPDEPKSRRGDVFQLGDHRLVCGDSLAVDDLELLMAGEKADLIFTDPPWNVNYDAVDETNPQGYRPRQILNDHMDAESWLTFCQGLTANLFIASKPGCPIYLVMSAQEWPVIDKCLREAGFHWSSTIIWAKDRLLLSRKDYHTQYEPIWYGWNEAAPRLAQLEDRTQSDLWQVDRPANSPEHPTSKPIELVERAIKNSSWRGNIILDLFGGGGSTLIAAHKSGRKARLLELDPRYCDVILNRFFKFTEIDPIRSDGVPWSEISLQTPAPELSTG